MIGMRRLNKMPAMFLWALTCFFIVGITLSVCFRGSARSEKSFSEKEAGIVPSGIFDDSEYGRRKRKKAPRPAVEKSEPASEKIKRKKTAKPERLVRSHKGRIKKRSAKRSAGKVKKNAVPEPATFVLENLKSDTRSRFPETPARLETSAELLKALLPVLLKKQEEKKEGSVKAGGLTSLALAEKLLKRSASKPTPDAANISGEKLSEEPEDGPEPDLISASDWKDLLEEVPELPEEPAGMIALQEPETKRTYGKRNALNDPEAEKDEIIFPRKKAKTPYQISAGSVIPCVLQTGINSDLPGMTTALVTRDVYDSPTGEHLLVPRGTKAIGKYGSQISFGQKRVLIVFSKLFLPDGSSVRIGSMQGSDRAGYSGFSDRVDAHYIKMFGSALLISIISTGAYAARNDRRSESGTAQDAFSDSLADQATQLGNRILEKHLNVQPTLIIRPGYRFNIMAQKTIFFKKPY